ncbi:GAF domain-containing protein [soil metagenome]
MVPVPAPLLSTAAVGSLCATFVTDLGVSAASITVFGVAGRQSTVCVSDEWGARLDALQFELGEGPRWEALGSRAPVLCPDLADGVPSAWPVLHEAARSRGAGAMFAFPMVMGAAVVGVVDLYCLAPYIGDRHFVSRASLLAGRVAGAAVQKALRSAEDHLSPESALAPALRREVHQATGMIVSQLDVSATEAFSRLQGHAFATGRSIEAIAHDVVGRVLDFTEQPD